MLIAASKIDAWRTFQDDMKPIPVVRMNWRVGMWINNPAWSNTVNHYATQALTPHIVHEIHHQWTGLRKQLVWRVINALVLIEVFNMRLQRIFCLMRAFFGEAEHDGLHVLEWSLWVIAQICIFFPQLGFALDRQHQWRGINPLENQAKVFHGFEISCPSLNFKP